MTLCGRINKLFGTGGGLRLTLYESFPEGFDPDTTPLIVEIDGLEVPLYCEKFEHVGASGASVTFAAISCASFKCSGAIAAGWKLSR